MGMAEQDRWVREIQSAASDLEKAGGDPAKKHQALQRLHYAEGQMQSYDRGPNRAELAQFQIPIPSLWSGDQDLQVFRKVKEGIKEGRFPGLRSFTYNVDPTTGVGRLSCTGDVATTIKVAEEVSELVPTGQH